MKKLIIASAVCLGLAASGALAAKLSITGSLVQSLTASDNLFLTKRPAGPAYESVSTLNLHFLTKTPLTNYRLDTNVSYFSYGGPGDVDTSLKTGLPAGVSFSADHSADPLTKYNFRASWQRADVASALLAETGQATGRGFSDTYLVTGGFTRDLTPIDSLSLTGTGSKVDFTAPGQVPYKDLAGTASWHHRLTPLADLTTALTGDWYSADDISGTERLLWNASTGLQVRLSPLLTVHGRIGEVFANFWARNGGAPTVSAALTPFQGGSGHAPVWDVGLAYRLSPTTNVALGAAKAITPTILGDLQQSTSYQASLSHEVNSHTQVSLSGQFAQLSAASTSYDLLSLSTGLTYVPARHYRMTLSYTFTQRTDAFGTARSNTVLYTLARDLTILP